MARLSPALCRNLVFNNVPAFSHRPAELGFIFAKLGQFSVRYLCFSVKTGVTFCRSAQTRNRVRPMGERSAPTTDSYPRHHSAPNGWFGVGIERETESKKCAVKQRGENFHPNEELECNPC